MKSSTVRVPRGWKYWAVSSNVFDQPAVYQAVDMRDDYDQKVWDSGRYFLSRGEAMEYVAAERARQKAAIRRKEKNKALAHAEAARRWRRVREILKK